MIMSSKEGAQYMWAMCALPLFGWAVTLWLIFTHERVTCFNYKSVIKWMDKNAHLHHDDQEAAAGAAAAHVGAKGGGRLAHLRAAAHRMRERYVSSAGAARVCVCALSELSELSE